MARPADPVWTYFLAGAKQWAKDTGNTVNTSFHNGDVASQQEAVRAAIAAKADGIVTTSPDPGSLVEVAKEANAAQHPDHQLQHARPEGELRRLCRRRQRHVRQALGAVSRRQGPGEVGRLRLDAGRSSRRHLWRAGRARASRASSSRSASPRKSPRRRSTRPRSSPAWPTTSPPTARRSRRSSASATSSTGSIKRVFDQVGVKPGEIPVVGWGNSLDTTQEVLNGYVNAAPVAGPAGDQLCRAVAGRRWRPAASRRASTSSPARSTRRTRPQIYDKILSGK